MKYCFMMFRPIWVLVLLYLGLASAQDLAAQVVNVTMSLGTNRIALGSNTTLRVYAQIIPAQQANTERIFSWYVDLLNSNGQVARFNFAQLQKPASDNDPQTSSLGVTQGANRRGVYDTFLNLPGAGRLSPVELFSLPVEGLAMGQTTFRVQAGSGVPNLSSDFIVAPAGGGEPLFGGDYSLASIDLEVIGGNHAPVLSAIADKTIDEGSALSLFAEAVDPDQPPNQLAFSLSDPPSGAQIDSVTGRFIWTPAEAQGPSTNTITVRVTDNGTPALSDQRAFRVVVNEVNSAPVLLPITNCIIEVGNLLSFTAAATDADLPANQLLFSLIDAPQGAAIDPVAGLFTWTPLATQAPSTNLVTVAVTDNGVPPRRAERSFQVTVPPLLEVRLWLVPRVSGQFAFRVEGNPGLTYTVLASTNLPSPTNWIVVLSTNAAAASFVFIDTDVPARRRFYRAQQP